ncbi:MAG: hypothetical protein ABSD92_05705 [Candidatus Bathyarchaeia archaeon]
MPDAERKFDYSKLSDFEISILIAERNCAVYRKEQYDELLNRIGEAKGYSEAEKQAQSKSELGQLPGIESDKLPWKSYKTKQVAGPEEAAWIFSNTQGAEALLSNVKSKDGQAKIAGFEYQLQGAQHQFISRKPVK